MGNPSVLVVEDDDTIRKLLVEYFGQQPDVRVDSARDGVEALHQVAMNRYDVIVLDVVMPKMSGVDFLNSMEAMMRDPSLRSFDDPPAVLVITATPASDLPQSSLEDRYPSLVRGVFRKPLDFPELGQCLRSIIPVIPPYVPR